MQHYEAERSVCNYFCFLSPDLNTGDTLATFNSSRKIPEFKDALKMAATGAAFLIVVSFVVAIQDSIFPKVWTADIDGIYKFVKPHLWSVY